jgi:hypothetical protein
MILQENEILASGAYNINLYNSEAKIINSNHPEDMMNVYSSIITYEYFLDLNVVDENSIPIKANVTISDEKGKIVFKGESDSTGRIGNIPLEYETVSLFEPTRQGPYSIHISENMSDTMTSVLMNEPKNLTIILGDLGDLVINNEDLNLSDDIVENDDIVDFKAKVHNLGTRTITNITVSFYLMNISIGEYHIDELIPGNNETASIEWTAIMGDWEVTVKASSDCKEINLIGNNEASSEIMVVEIAIESWESYSNETWEINGDMVIEEGGVLELDNVTIIMKSTYDVLLFNVTKGGELIMRNCNISAYRYYLPFEFRIYGKATIERTILSGMGYEGSSYYYWWYTEAGGLQIYSDDVRVTNSTIRDNDIGIFCSGSKPYIYNNSIIDNDGTGIYCHNSNATIFRNKIISNYWYGIYVDSSYYSWNTEPIIDNNTIEMSRTGIQVDYSQARISNNTIINNDEGVDSTESRIKIINNKIKNNEEGIRDRYSKTGYIADNLIVNNSVGINLRGSIFNITGNEIIHNGYGIEIGERNYEDSSISFIEKNIVSHNSRSGFMIYGFFPVIKNNTIGNNIEWGIDIINGDAQIEGNRFDYDNRSNGQGRIIKRMTLAVKVSDPSGHQLSYVNMKITSSNGTVFVNRNLRHGSWSSEYWFDNTPPIYIQENNGNENLYDYLVEVEKEGITNSTWVTINDPKEVTLQLSLLPDLKITEIEIGEYFHWFNEGSYPKEDDVITVRIYVRNNGNGTAFNITVKTFIDGNQKDEQTITRIPPKDTEDIYFKWKAKGGNITFEAQVDSKNNIEELNENNNIAINHKKFESLPPDLDIINTILIIIFIFLIMTFIFWVRWRYEVWRRN